MEKELYSKIIYFKDYSNKDIFDIEVEKEYKRIKQEYLGCVVTKEFYKGNNILIRACKIEKLQTKEKEPEEKQYLRDRSDGFKSGGRDRERSKVSVKYL